MSGNRFDSATGGFGVLYFGTTLSVCFGETLARFRPSPGVLAEVKEDWHALGYMLVGAVSAEWRQRRTAVRVSVPESAVFLDIESVHTHQFLRTKLALGLSELGYDDLDISMIRGRDRRITRLIAGWAFSAHEEGQPLFAGIRYLSRVCTDWECWAVFHDIDIEAVETLPIQREMPELRDIADTFDLVIH
jgi:RES domain